MKTALYIRVSTEDQVKEGYSLEVQRQYLKSFPKREGKDYYINRIEEFLEGYDPNKKVMGKETKKTYIESAF